MLTPFIQLDVFEIPRSGQMFAHLKAFYRYFVQFCFFICQYFTKKLKWNQGDISGK